MQESDDAFLDELHEQLDASRFTPGQVRLAVAAWIVLLVLWGLCQ